MSFIILATGYVNCLCCLASPLFARDIHEPHFCAEHTQWDVSWQYGEEPNLWINLGVNLLIHLYVRQFHYSNGIARTSMKWSNLLKEWVDLPLKCCRVCAIWRKGLAPHVLYIFLRQASPPKHIWTRVNFPIFLISFLCKSGWLK